jgi:hypothetical protein
MLFYKTRTNCMLIITVLDDLSTFEYIENMMMYWSMNMIYGVEWIMWLYDVVGNFVDYDFIVNECDFEWVIKLGTWCIACLRAQPSYLRAYEHNPVTCVPTNTTLLLAYAYIYCDVMKCVARLIYYNFDRRVSMYMSLNGREHMHISITWLHVFRLDIVVAWFMKHWIWVCIDDCIAQN